MSKIKFHQLTDGEKKKYLGEFYTMVSLLGNRDEVKNFFKDLLTLSEVVMISRRIQIAQMLLSGFTHEEIRQKLGVGFSNISQVDKWLNNGFGGYRKTIKQFQDKNGKNKPNEDWDVPFSFDAIRKKYPGHFLLVNALKKNKK